MYFSFYRTLMILFIKISALKAKDTKLAAFFLKKGNNGERYRTI